jgi:ATP-dependent Clp protease ATP-binding subunit ClpA
MVVASIEARKLRHGSICSDHMLLAAVLQPRDSMWGNAVDALYSLGATEEAVRQGVETRRVPLDDPPEFVPLSDEAKNVLYEALTAALSHEVEEASVMPTHYLLAMMSRPEFAARQILEALGVTSEALRKRLESG